MMYVVGIVLSIEAASCDGMHIAPRCQDKQFIGLSLNAVQDALAPTKVLRENKCTDCHKLSQARNVNF